MNDRKITTMDELIEALEGRGAVMCCGDDGAYKHWEFVSFACTYGDLKRAVLDGRVYKLKEGDRVSLDFTKESAA